MKNWLQQKVKLGQTDLYTGRLGIGAACGAPTDAIEEAFEAGCNYLYWGALKNSRMAAAIWNIIGRGKRDDLILVIQDFRRTPKGVEKSLIRGLCLRTEEIKSLIENECWLSNSVLTDFPRRPDKCKSGNKNICLIRSDRDFH